MPTVLQKSQKFRVRVSGSYRTYKSSGYGYGSVTELTEVPGRCKSDVLVPRGFVERRTELTEVRSSECPAELKEVPGTGMNVLQNLRKFFVG